MLRNHAERYVDFNRSFGLKYHTNAALIRRFVEYAEPFGDAALYTHRIVAWSKLGSTQDAARRRYDCLRRFCIFMNGEDSRHEIPPRGLFGDKQPRRPTPHIFRPKDIRRIMDEALRQGPPGSICPHTFHHIFGLLAATGLRISEALQLTFSDVTEEGLLIRKSKGDKTRLVPLHITTRTALDRFLEIRRGVRTASNELFVVSHGRVPTKTRVHVVFVEILRRLGLRGPTGTPGPRLHDLRHTFAVRSLEQCPHDSTSVSRHIEALSTYLGHSAPQASYWYLEATPVLLRQIAEANELHAKGETS